MTEISMRFKIIQEFCKKELFGDATKIIEFIMKNDDEHKILEVSKVYKDKLDKLDDKEEALFMIEPDQYVNYDEWVKWEQERLDLEADKEILQAAIDAIVCSVGEWWLCTEWLGKKLEAKNEFVIFHNGYAIWGRTEWGYDPSADPIFKEIASDIEILPGQKYDWSKFIEEDK